MLLECDVAIIGAGPAGVAAGIELKRAGVDCCIFDKAVFPRNKLCGGLVTQKAIELLSDLLSEDFPQSLIKNRTTHVDIEQRGATISKLDCSMPFTLIDRYEFDSWLVEKYKKLGGRIFEGAQVIKIIDISRSILLDNGDRVAFKYLIGADGAKGISAKHVGNGNRLMALGIETNLAADVIKYHSYTIKLDVGYLPDGYVWTFPKGDLVTIGLACTQNREIDYVAILKKYLKEIYGYNGPVNIKGAFLPYGKHSATIVNKDYNFFLVGDAAGFVDCVTGEGIYFAIKSGILAARSIIEYNSQKSDEAITSYEKNCLEIVNLVNGSAKCMSYFYKYKHLILSIIKGHSRPIAFICDNQVSLYKYHFEIMKIIKDYLRSRKKEGDSCGKVEK